MVLRIAIVAAGLLLVAPPFYLRAQEFGRFTMNVGGGVSVPLNPTASYVGVSGNFTGAAGYHLGNHGTILGEFMWSGLPPNIVNQPLLAPSGHINLYTLTAVYRYQVDSLNGWPFGAYVIGGGGWYYRYGTLDLNFLLPIGAPCTRSYFYWGYECDSSGYVAGTTVASRGNSAGGVNGGVGFTYPLGDSGLRFYIESRFHYAWSNRVPTTLVPVTFGVRFN